MLSPADVHIELDPHIRPRRGVEPMARGVKAKTAEPARRARKPVPPAKAKAKVAAAKKPAAAAKPSSVTPARALSKDALRAQVEKLERANAALRTKNREANRLPSCPRPGWRS